MFPSSFQGSSSATSSLKDLTFTTKGGGTTGPVFNFGNGTSSSPWLWVGLAAGGLVLVAVLFKLIKK